MSTNTTEEAKSPEEWKILALTERIGQLTAQYENQVTDLRVALTMLTQEYDAYKASHEKKAK